MKTRKIVLTVLIGILLLGAVGGSVWAYMIKRTQTEENLLTPARVECQLYEVKNADTTQKTSVTVENTGNVNAYVRVRMVSYWVDSSTGNVVSKPSQAPTFTLGSGWIAGSNNTYYAQEALAPGAFTSNLLGSAITLSLSSEGYLQVIEVFAEVIQAQPTSAAVESWGVTVNAAGQVTAAP